MKDIYVTALVFNIFKMAVQCFLTASNFPTLMAQMIFAQIQQASGPDSRKVGKSLLENKKNHFETVVSKGNLDELEQRLFSRGIVLFPS